MPSVDVTSLITGLNPIRHTSSYTMPVLSPRHSTPSALTGSYRSTFSSSSIDRPYTNSYSTPRTYSYSERYTSRAYTSDDGKKAYSRYASITEDGVTSRYREEGRESSAKRDISRDSGYRDSSSTRSNSLRDNSLTRNDVNSRNELSTISVLESVADFRSKYSPANYVPAVLRKYDTYSRSKSIGTDIGKPPIERSEVKTIKLKKVINENSVCNGVALTNRTNKLDNNEPGDDNGNRTSVAEIRKKFDPNPNFCNRKISPTNGLFIEGVAIRAETIKTQKTNVENEINKTNATNNEIKHDTDRRSQKLLNEAETHINTKLFIGRPAKCSKTTDLTSQEPETSENNISTQEKFASRQDNSPAKNETENSENWNENASMELSDSSKVFNHTSNFPSYISNKDLNEAMNEGDDSDVENNSIDIFYKNANNVSNNF